MLKVFSRGSRAKVFNDVEAIIIDPLHLHGPDSTNPISIKAFINNIRTVAKCDAPILFLTISKELEAYDEKLKKLGVAGVTGKVIWPKELK